MDAGSLAQVVEPGNGGVAAEEDEFGLACIFEGLRVALCTTGRRREISSFIASTQPRSKGNCYPIRMISQTSPAVMAVTATAALPISLAFFDK